MPLKHFMAAVLDEVALEGLNGISLPNLWKRLEVLGKKFTIKMDPFSKDYIWQLIKCHPDVQIYQVSIDHPEIVIFDRKQIQADNNVSSSRPVSDGSIQIIDKENVRGACSQFSTRKLIHDEVQQMTLTNVFKVYGENKVVLVASQPVRTATLMRENWDKYSTLTAPEYAILEQVGRSRYNGAASFGIENLQEFISDSKLFWYMKKKLVMDGLIKSQMYESASTTECKYMRGSLLHLPWFYSDNPTNIALLLDKVVSYVIKKPQRKACLLDVRHSLDVNEKMAKTLVKNCHPWLERIDESFTDFYGGDLNVAMLQEYASIFRTNVQAAQGRVTRNVAVLRWTGRPFSYRDYCQVNEEKNLDDQDDSNNYPQLPNLNIDESLLRQFVCVVANEPMSTLQMLEHFSISRYTIRALLKLAVRRNLVAAFVVTDKTNDVAKYCLIKDGKSFKSHSVSRSMNVSILSCDTRKEKRRNHILEVLNRDRVISNVPNLRKEMMAREEQQGHTTKMDRKSFKRIVDDLVNQKLLKTMSVDLIKGKLDLICCPDMTSTDDAIVALIDFHNEMIRKRMKPSTTQSANAESSLSVERPFAQSTPVGRPSTTQTKAEKRKSIPRIDERMNYKFGFLPKMKRKQVLHQYLWYLVYGLSADATTLQLDKPDTNGVGVYVDDFTWKRYVRPITKYKGYPDGWFVMSDAFSTLPVGILFSLINVRFHLPELDEIILDPKRRILPLYALSEQIQDAIMDNRVYPLAFANLIQSLSAQGLVTMKEISASTIKDQLMSYLHKNASLLDTRSSNPGYNIVTEKDYPKLSFTFNTAVDVERYWLFMLEIATNTPLGSRRSVTKNSKDNESVVDLDESTTDTVMDSNPPENRTVPQASNNAPNKAAKTSTSKTRSKSHRVVKSVEDVIDDGSVPVEKMGACGFDSTEFSHNVTQWYTRFVPLAVPEPIESNIPGFQLLDSKKKKSNLYGSNSRSKKSLVPTVPQSQESLVPLYHTLFDDVNLDAEVREFRHSYEAPIVKPAPPPTAVTPKPDPVKKKETTVKKPKVEPDDVDKELDKVLVKRRVQWKSKEDFIVMLCKVASVIVIGRTARGTLCLAWNAIRDILRRYCPEYSMDKTSAACARRVLFLLKCKPIVRTETHVMLTDCMNDANIQKEFAVGVGPWNHMMRHDLDKCIKKFNTLVDHLVGKFGTDSFTSSTSQVPSRLHPNLPDTMEELNQLYLVKPLISARAVRVPFPHTNNLTDITVMTLYNVILGSFEMETDKIRSADSRLGSILNQYPSDHIGNAIIFMQNNQIVTKPKTDNKESNKTLGLIRLKLTQKFEQQCLSDLFLYTRFIMEAARNLTEMRSNLALPDTLVFSGVKTGALTSVIMEFIMDEDPSLIFTYSDKNIVQCDEEDTDKVNETPETCVDTNSGICSRSGVICNTLGFSTTAKRIDIQLNIQEGQVSFTPDRNRLSDHHATALDSWSSVLARLDETFASKDFIRSSEAIHKRARQPILQDLQTKLLTFIKTGTFFGKTNIEISDHFAQNPEVTNVLKYLQDIGEVHEVGVKIPQFVSREFLRPWMLRSRPSRSITVTKPSATQSTTLSVNGTPEESLPTIPSDPSLENRLKGSTEVSTSDIEKANSGILKRNALESDSNTVEPPTKKTKLNTDLFFLPEPWISISGSIQPTVFKVMVENVFSKIFREPGLTQAKLILFFDSYLIPRTIRIIVKILHEIGAIRCVRTISKGKSILFSKRNAISISDDVILGCDEELTLIPSNKCVSCLGGFMEQLILEKSSFDQFRYSSIESQIWDGCLNETIPEDDSNCFNKS